MGRERRWRESLSGNGEKMRNWEGIEAMLRDRMNGERR